MSGYEDSQDPYEHVHATTNPLQEQDYAFAHPSYASHNSIVQASLFEYTTNAYHAAIPASPNYPARDAYYSDQGAPYLGLRTHDFVRVTAYRPTSGMQGTKLFIYIRSTDELAAAPQLYFSVMFGAKRCSTAITKLESSGPYLEYRVATDIPFFEAPTWDEYQVPLFLHMEDESGQSLGVVEVGDFKYAGPFDYQTQAPFSQVSRKRKASDEAVSLAQSPAKKPSYQFLRDRAHEVAPAYSYAYPPASEEPQSLRAHSDSCYGLMGPYGEPFSQNDHQQSLQQPFSYYHRPASPQHLFPAQAHGLRAARYSPCLTTDRPSSTISRREPPTAPATQAILSSAAPDTPILIRTSILQSSPSLRAGAPSSCQSFNPYALYPNKAILRIEGNLDAMAEGWTRHEWKAKRRLVEFHRSQSDNTITTSFKPVAPDERLPNSICISCILWEDRQECYVTSVDTIHLLESVVAVRFTVEEKNRIRRNLEGFRPQTISKGKADSEQFFRLIMAFPNPRPRNIEKDVKVFPWRILAHALKKIIGKYSASYSSTAGALHPPVSDACGSGGTPGSTRDHHLSLSPRPTPMITPSQAYYKPMTSTTMSPPDMKPAEIFSPSTSATSHRPSLPAPSDAYWQRHMQSASNYPSMTPAAGRSSWDLGSYINESPVTATPENVQGLPYLRGFQFEPQQGLQQDSPPLPRQQIAHPTSTS